MADKEKETKAKTPKVKDTADKAPKTAKTKAATAPKAPKKPAAPKKADSKPAKETKKASVLADTPVNEAQAKAIVTYVRIAPRKVKIVLDLIRNKPLDVALATVKHTPKIASEVVYKLLKSAAANAENNHHMNKDALYVAETFVNPGPVLKRVMPRAQGRAFRILKRTSHITVVLKEKEA